VKRECRYFFFLAAAFFAGFLAVAFLAGFLAASFLAGFLVAIDDPPFPSAVARRRKFWAGWCGWWHHASMRDV